MSPRILKAIAALVSERDALASRLGHVTAAIEALEKLEGGAPAVAPAAAPRPKQAFVPRPAPVLGKIEALRPARGTCERVGCSKEFAQPTQGRQRHYCSVSCGKKARKAGVAVIPPPMAAHAPQRMPRADRPVDDSELDALLARSRRGAA